MATQPTTAAPPPGSARELVKAMRERNAPRRAEVARRVASLRRIAEQLRAASRAMAREPADDQQPHRRHDTPSRHDRLHRPRDRKIDGHEVEADRVEVRGEPGKQAGVLDELEPERT